MTVLTSRLVSTCIISEFGGHEFAARNLPKCFSDLRVS